MGLILGEKFINTIFIKDDSKLERDITYLKSIRDNVVEKDKIDQDIKLMEIGLYGEKQISFELKNANLGMYVLHDVILQYEDLTAQIDYVVVTKGYTYFIECKNLVGDLTVDNKGQFVRTICYGNRKNKEAIYSPYTQGERHKEIFMKKWYKKNSGLMGRIFEKGVRSNIKNLIVLSNPKGILDIKYAPKEIKNCTIRVDQLVSYIKKDLESYDSTLYSSRKAMEGIAQSYLNAHVNTVSDFSNKYTITFKNNSVESKNTFNVDELENEVMIKSFSNNSVDSDLAKRLKEFRRQKSSSNKIPAYYIFTDKELEELISSNIKTLEELKNSKILSDIKVRLHGQEIIEVINSNIL